MYGIASNFFPLCTLQIIVVYYSDWQKNPSKYQEETVAIFFKLIQSQQFEKFWEDTYISTIIPNWTE